jgi:uncharacterized protein (DUF1330 family)
MAKGYWLAQVEVTDPQGYKDYVAANQAAFRKYGVRYVVRAGRHEALEGTCRSRLVVIEFPDYETALACYRSPEYQHALKLRQGRAIADIAVGRGLRRPAALVHFSTWLTYWAVIGRL